ncbi:MAG: hypothetical protein KAX38_03635, partial [Candidatus Krumholzibacteria bacterium]|nr:hypothetical protein [Candidatus Krumholzibacteria bacterium]
MFLTEEKALKKIQQDRLRGDINRARQRALSALEKWPDEFDLAMEAIRACFDLSDYHEAVSLLKTTIRRHTKNRTHILEYARETFMSSFNPFLGSFIIEVLLREKNIEGIEDILRTSPESFINDLINRSETRSKGFSEEAHTITSGYADNELLLGLLYIQDKQFKKATEPLGNALNSSTDDARLIGSILLNLEREQPANADIKFYLGQVSVLLSHPDKAEARFFQCLDLDNPPLEKL